LASAIGADYGVEFGEVEAAPPFVFGATVEGVVACRDVLEPVLAATGLSVRDADDGLALALPKPRLATEIMAEDVVATERALTARRRPDPSAALGQLALIYPDHQRSYLTGTA